MTASQTFNNNQHKYYPRNGANSHIISRKGSIQIAQEKLSQLLKDIKSKRIKKKKLDFASETVNINTESGVALASNNEINND